MQIGLIGCGNMARALARGWGRPVLCSDPIAQRARSLAAEGGGGEASRDAQLEAEVGELFAGLGTLVVVEDALVDVAMGLMSCGPAYVALVAEAQIDAGVRRGIPAAQGAELVVQTLAGTAE